MKYMSFRVTLLALEKLYGFFSANELVTGNIDGHDK